MLFSPASTFKIPNTLIALNEGVVTKDSVIVGIKK
jgi:beta-lactamase class D